MTEHKFTDEEIIRALECCSDCECYNAKAQEDCPLIKVPFCKNYMRKQALDLINRQKAEIENLKEGWNYIPVEAAQALRDRAVLQAVKEVEARVKQYLKGLIDCGVDAVEVTEFNAELHKIINGRRECPQCRYFVGCEGAVGGMVCGDFKEKEAEKDCGKG